MRCVKGEKRSHKHLILLLELRHSGTGIDHGDGAKEIPCRDPMIVLKHQKSKHTKCFPITPCLGTKTLRCPCYSELCSQPSLITFLRIY